MIREVGALYVILNSSQNWSRGRKYMLGSIGDSTPRTPTTVWGSFFSPYPAPLLVSSKVVKAMGLEVPHRGTKLVCGG